MLLCLCIHTCACCWHLAVNASLPVLIVHACTLPSCFRSVQSRHSQLSQAQKSAAPALRDVQLMRVQILHARIYLGMRPCIAIAGNYKTANTFEARLQNRTAGTLCDFMHRNQVWTARKVLQRLSFVLYQNFLVGKSGSK